MSIVIDAGKVRRLTINGRPHFPTLYQVAGRVVELYRIRTLATVIEKSYLTLFKWEKVGLLPKPLFAMQGKALGNCKRWYAREQILNIAEVYRRYPIKQGKKRLLHDNFHALLRAVFYKMTVLTSEEFDELEKELRMYAETSHQSASTQTSGSDPVGEVRSSLSRTQTVGRATPVATPGTGYPTGTVATVRERPEGKHQVGTLVPRRSLG